MDRTEFLEIDGVKLAYRASRGNRKLAGVMWLGGFHSDMLGEKATALHAAAEAQGRSFLRFDYFGHGESGGRFEEGTIGRWRADALAMLDALFSDGPVVLAGSSMGGWMALHCALARPERVKGLMLLAPAADFTDRLMWPSFSETVRRQIMETGRWMRPSPYDPAGYPITRELIEEGRRWNLMDTPIRLGVPVRILQGERDPDVPWSHAFKLVEQIATDDVVFSLVKDGDHRLSRPQDIERIVRETQGLCDQVDRQA